MKKAVIFDIDGTLLNTLDSIAYCGNLALEHFGLPNVQTDAFPQFVGHGVQKLIEGIFAYVDADKDIFDYFRSYYLDVYEKNGLYKITPYSGITELLDELHALDIKLAVLSNKPHAIVKNATDSFFKGKFDLVYGQRENIPAKPNPYIIKKILNNFDINPTDCIFCGDSRVDIETALNSQTMALGASWGFYGDSQFENADAILYKPLDMLKYI